MKALNWLLWLGGILIGLGIGGLLCSQAHAQALPGGNDLRQGGPAYYGPQPALPYSYSPPAVQAPQYNGYGAFRPPVTCQTVGNMTYCN